MAGHVVLVGLMGSGKTTVGRRVADRLARDFVDADDALEVVADRTIAEIFASDGEAAFRALEAEVLEDLLEHHDATVIAAGGGVVLSPESRERLRRPEVTVVWLDADPAFVASRVSAKPNRPLLDGADPRELLTRLHRERAPLYAEVADLTVEVAPFHHEEEHPKRALAVRIAELVTAHEAGVRA